MSSVFHSLPADTTLPPEIGDGSAWYGPDLKGSTDWVERLSEAEIAEQAELSLDLSTRLA